MRFYQINKKRIQEVITIFSFSFLLLSSFIPQLITAPPANAIVFSYPRLNLQKAEPIAPSIKELPVKSSAQDVTYPLIKESESDFYYQADLASFQAWFYDRAEKKAITRIGIDPQHYLEFFLPKEKKVPINLTEKGYSYQVSQDLEIKYTIKDNELKEDIVLNQSPTDGSFKFSYQEEGLFHVVGGEEYYFFRSDSLAKIFKFQKPTVRDAKGISGAISLELTDDEIVFQLDSAFLAQASYPITIDPVTVGTTTSSGSTGPDKDRHIVRSSRGIMVEVWYQNSTNYLVGSRSLDDGETWLQLNADSAGSTVIGANSLTAAISDYSLFLDQYDNVNLAYSGLCSGESYTSVCYRQLSANGTNNQWTVGSEYTVSAGLINMTVVRPSVIESSNSTIYVAVDKEGAGSDDTVIRYFTNGTSWADESGTAVASTDQPVLIMEPGTNERMEFYWKAADSTLYFNYYNGTSWGGETSVANIGASPSYSVATGSALPDNIHLVYNSARTYYRSYNGTSWSGATTLDSGTKNKAVITYNGGDLFVFASIIDGSVTRIKYKRYDGSSWDSSWTYVSDIFATFESVQTLDVQSNPDIWTNETTDAGDYGEADVPFLLTPTVDYLYIGRNATFLNVTFFLSTNASSTVTPDWEYWNGSAWTDITETDNTSGFTTSGSVTWAGLSGWAQTSVNSVTKYWVRVTGASTPTTKPVASYILPGQSAGSPTSIERIIEETTFEQVNQDGFGDNVNDDILALEVFNGYLYAGTQKPSSNGEVWRSNNGVTWSQVSTDGFGDSNNKGFTAILTAGEYVYVGTQNTSTGTEVWRSTNGTGFAQVNSDGFGSANNTITEKFLVFNDYLYAATYNSTDGTQVFRCSITNCDESGDWAQVNDNGFGDVNNITTPTFIVVDISGTQYIYAGTENTPAGGGLLYRCSESSGCDSGDDWPSVLSQPGFGDSSNISLKSGEVFNSALYVGTYNESTGGELWRCDISSDCNEDGDFSQVNDDGFGDSNNQSVQALKTYYGNYLYAGTAKKDTGGVGAELWRCTLASACDGTGDWSQIGTDGFGDKYNNAINVFHLFRDYMFMGGTDTTYGSPLHRNFYERALVSWASGAASPYNVKYDEIRYRARQESWRWYDDQSSADPSTAYADENTTGSPVGKLNDVRVRITLREDGHYSGANIRMKLQYSTDDSQFYDVADQADTYAPWRYYNGGGTDDSTIGTQRLTDSDTKGPYVEELLVVSTFDQGINDWTEWDFSIENYDATANSTYYFRAVWSDSDEDVVLTSGKTHPTLTTASSYTLSLSTPTSITLTGYTLGSGNGTSVTTFNASQKITMRDDTGSGNGWSVTATSTNLTIGSYTITANSINWSTGTITPLLAASMTGVSAGGGGAMHPTTPVTVATASASNGAGGYTIQPTITVSDLDNEQAGNYSGTFTLTIQ
ncbi:MAG: hypothetical protein COT24_02420 [Candidatus Kerfeldbacteria bacterium CG08_land_8_20_14_0_20_40_16]|uniref:Uncharacterized protein n=1 Tax=Candidatus Kerfeldbacteria bacterium CG08_land_8_20_14_0_20_40_16 TaxID=2014244 RepID=A0A2H0YVX7_9BACT|nr:MAG: hypothetical protein COT24_02420 [Candidatus Kerfeldbacteria bacterium CG08_land_8_20_14_0_20_40_16]